MDEHRQNRVLAIQMLSSLIVAASVVTLTRRLNRADNHSANLGSHQGASDANPHISAEPSPLPVESLKSRLVRRAFNYSILVVIALMTIRFGSFESSTEIGILCAGVVLYFGWGLFGSRWNNRVDLLYRLRDLVLAAIAIGLAVQVITSREDLLNRAFYFAVIMSLGGLALWWSEQHVVGSKANLGASLVGGFVVAAALFTFQLAVDEDARKQEFQSAVAFQRDLTGVDLYGQDLNTLHLYGKILKGADLRSADLTSAYLVRANLTDAWMSEANLTEAALSEAILDGVDLTQANLTNADLSDITKLDGADLSGANLQRADLSATNFSGAVLDGASLVAAKQDEGLGEVNLSDVSLVEADLSEANLAFSDLAQADLSRATLLDTDLTGADLSNAVVESASLAPDSMRGANLRGVDLRSFNLEAIPLEKAIFDRETRWSKDFDPVQASVYLMRSGANLRKAELSDTNLSSLRLQGADLRGAILNNADLQYSLLNDSNLRGAELLGAKLRGADLTGANLEGAILGGADLRQAVMRNVQLRNAEADDETRWPRGFNPKAAGVRIIRQGE